MFVSVIALHYEIIMFRSFYMIHFSDTEDSDSLYTVLFYGICISVPSCFCIDCIGTFKAKGVLSREMFGKHQIIIINGLSYP